jgi:hypothetical protein
MIGHGVSDNAHGFTVCRHKITRTPRPKRDSS